MILYYEILLIKMENLDKKFILYLTKGVRIHISFINIANIIRV